MNVRPYRTKLKNWYGSATWSGSLEVTKEARDRDMVVNQIAQTTSQATKVYKNIEETPSQKMIVTLAINHH